jgi:uncharacterized coiled-coil protein SlyX
VSELLALLKAGWTPGAIGIWTFGPVIILILGAGLWKGMPAVLDAWTRRADAESARTDREFERLERQIRASDDRHADCERRCEALVRRMNEQDQTINGLRAQMTQVQISAVRVGAAPETVTEALIAQLDHVPGADGKVVEIRPRKD